MVVVVHFADHRLNMKKMRFSWNQTQRRVRLKRPWTMEIKVRYYVSVLQIWQLELLGNVGVLRVTKCLSVLRYLHHLCCTWNWIELQSILLVLRSLILTKLLARFFSCSRGLSSNGPRTSARPCAGECPPPKRRSTRLGGNRMSRNHQRHRSPRPGRKIPVVLKTHTCMTSPIQVQRLVVRVRCPVKQMALAFFGHFSVVDRNVFEMTEKNYVISVRMSENIG